MFERVIYVRNDEREKIGVITMIYEAGQFGLGISLCTTALDKFDRNVGRQIARERAEACLKTTPLLLKDIGHLSVIELAKLSGSNFCLGSDTDSIRRIVYILRAYNFMVEDMVYTLALQKVKAETVR